MVPKSIGSYSVKYVGKESNNSLPRLIIKGNVSILTVLSSFVIEIFSLHMEGGKTKVPFL